jgi:hypothetical protein
VVALLARAAAGIDEPGRILRSSTGKA